MQYLKEEYEQIHFSGSTAKLESGAFLGSSIF